MKHLQGLVGVMRVIVCLVLVVVRELHLFDEIHLYRSTISRRSVLKVFHLLNGWVIQSLQWQARLMHCHSIYPTTLQIRIEFDRLDRPYPRGILKRLLLVWILLCHLGHQVLYLVLY